MKSLEIKLATVWVSAWLALGVAVQAQPALERTILPIADPLYEPITELDARNAKAPPPFTIKVPEGAPNVVIVLIDDIGFGAASGFGGAIQTPTLDRLSAGGLRYNQFHTTALCSPTRMAILTGRNHHSANAGSVMEVATAFPGNRGQRWNSVAPVAEMLRLNGYSTAAFGKYHETAPWEVSVSGPFDRWPTPLGFRQVLRLYWRRDQSVCAGHSRRHHPGRSARRSRLPFHHRYDQPGDYLDTFAAVTDPG